MLVQNLMNYLYLAQDYWLIVSEKHPWYKYNRMV